MINTITASHSALYDNAKTTLQLAGCQREHRYYVVQDFIKSILIVEIREKTTTMNRITQMKSEYIYSREI